MIVSKTPFCMSFGGGRSDLPGCYREELGAVVSPAIDEHVYIAVNRKFDQKIRITDLKPVSFRFDRAGSQIAFYQPVDLL